MASVFALAGWITFGAYRLMCVELAVATRPWAWIAFVLYLTVYFAGAFIPQNWPILRTVGVFSAMGIVVSVGATYLSAFALYRDPLTFRRLNTYARSGRQRRFFEEMPTWMASLNVAGVFMAICAAMHFAPEYSSDRKRAARRRCDMAVRRP